MKKFVCLCVLSLSVAGILCACSGEEKGTNTTDNVKVVELEEINEHTTQELKDNKSYKIELSQELIAQEFDGDIESYASTYGYKIVKNEDGSTVLKMDGEQYRLMLSRVGVKAMRKIGELVDSDDFSYTVKIDKYSDDFGYIRVLVDGKKLKKANNAEGFASELSRCALCYQGYLNMQQSSCKIVLADAESGETVFERVYTE